MRQSELRRFNYELAEIKQIEVDRTGNVSFMTCRSSQNSLNCGQLAPQFLRSAGITELDRRIKKFRSAFFAIDRLRFVNRRTTQRRQRVIERGNFFSRIPQIGEAFAEIRPESNAGSHRNPRTS